MKPYLTKEISGDVVILQPEDVVVWSEVTSELRVLLLDLVKARNTKLIVDFRKVRHVNSTAIGILTSLHVNYSRRSGKVVLCNVAKNIQNILKLTKLISIFEIFDNQAEALKMFSKI